MGLWLRWRGWKCEGPSPRQTSAGILILGPGLERWQMETELLEVHLGLNTRWWSAAERDHLEAPAPSKGPILPAPGEGLILVPFNAPNLVELLRKSASNNIQLVSLAPELRRIRFNTPFVSGKFPDRDLSYIHRVFSYYT